MDLPARPALQVASHPTRSFCIYNCVITHTYKKKIIVFFALCAQVGRETREEAGSPKVRSCFCCSSTNTKDLGVTCKNQHTRRHRLDALIKAIFFSCSFTCKLFVSANTSYYYRDVVFPHFYANNLVITSLLLFIRDTAEPDRKRKRAPEDKSKNGGDEEKRREEGKGKDGEAKEPEAKKKKQSKDDASSSSDDDEVNLVNLLHEAPYCF